MTLGYLQWSDCQVLTNQVLKVFTVSRDVYIKTFNDLVILSSITFVLYQWLICAENPAYRLPALQRACVGIKHTYLYLNLYLCIKHTYLYLCKYINSLSEI